MPVIWNGQKYKKKYMAFRIYVMWRVVLSSHRHPVSLPWFNLLEFSSKYFNGEFGLWQAFLNFVREPHTCSVQWQNGYEFSCPAWLCVWNWEVLMWLVLHGQAIVWNGNALHVWLAATFHKTQYRCTTSHAVKYSMMRDFWFWVDFCPSKFDSLSMLSFNDEHTYELHFTMINARSQ